LIPIRLHKDKLEDSGPRTDPEKELLLLCTRTTVDADTAARIKIRLRNEINWPALFETALRHGVMPLLYRSLNNTCPDGIPKVFLGRLRDAFYANAAHNAVFSGELLKILRLFETNGIFAVPFKGPALAASVYGNPALRQFGDLDILVRPEEAEPARDLLISNGYQDTSQLSDRHRAAFYRARKVYELVRRDNKILVELHWSVTSWTFFFPLKPSYVWERLVTGSLENTAVRMLSPEDLLLVLCVHGAKHYWSKLGWICDVAELLRVQSGLKWTDVLLQARQLGGTRILYLGLFLAHVLLDAELPREVWQEINSDPVVFQLAAEVQTRLFAEARGELSAANDPAFYLKLRERMRERMACALYLAYLKLPARAKAAVLLSTHGGLAGLKLLRPLFRKTL
jgi:hypothetical protein